MSTKEGGARCPPSQCCEDERRGEGGEIMVTEDTTRVVGIYYLLLS